MRQVIQFLGDTREVYELYCHSVDNSADGQKTIHKVGLVSAIF